MYLPVGRKTIATLQLPLLSKELIAHCHSTRTYHDTWLLLLLLLPQASYFCKCLSNWNCSMITVIRLHEQCRGTYTSYRYCIHLRVHTTAIQPRVIILLNGQLYTYVHSSLSLVVCKNVPRGHITSIIYVYTCSIFMVINAAIRGASKSGFISQKLLLPYNCQTSFLHNTIPDKRLKICTMYLQSMLQ